jgi:putative PIN family toxin of toxin-antitoxin system
MTPPRVVLDTNIVLSALVFARGRLSPLRAFWTQKLCYPLVSTVTTAELMRALGYAKFRLSIEDQHELLADYLPYCTTVRMPARPPKTPACRDPADSAYLQLAIVGKADYVVTGDNDILTLNGKLRPQIISAARFQDLLARG